MTSYNDVVKTAVRSCFACPTVYEGQLVNGDDYYLRYRWGTATFCNESIQISASMSFPQYSDGALDEKDFRELVVALHEDVEEQFRRAIEEIFNELEHIWTLHNESEHWETFLENFDESTLRNIAMGRYHSLYSAEEALQRLIKELEWVNNYE